MVTLSFSYQIKCRGTSGGITTYGRFTKGMDVSSAEQGGFLEKTEVELENISSHQNDERNNVEEKNKFVTVTFEDLCLEKVTSVEGDLHRAVQDASQNLSQSVVDTNQERSSSVNKNAYGLEEVVSSNVVSNEYECRICRCIGDENLLSPCKCSGSAGWVHESCLVRWLKLSHSSQCEVCFQKIVVKKRTKPLKEWKRPTGEFGPCGRLDIWYMFICLFGISTIIGFAIFQATVKSKEPETSIIFSAIYVLCSILILMRVKYFYQWFTQRSMFWEKWLVLNQLWTIRSSDQIPQEVMVSTV